MDIQSPDITMALSQATQQTKLQNLKDMASEADLKRTGDAAREFEAVFVAEMLKPMFEDLNTAPPFGGGKAEEIFRGILLQEYGKNIASTQSIGIADHVKAALLKM